MTDAREAVTLRIQQMQEADKLRMARQMEFNRRYADLASNPSFVGAYAFSPVTYWAIVIAFCFVLLVAVNVMDQKRGDALNWTTVEKAWMKDCAGMGKTIDDCAYSWDWSPTLRGKYWEKVEKAVDGTAN